MNQDSIFNMLLKNKELNKPAIDFNNYTINYSDFISRVNAFAEIITSRFMIHENKYTSCIIMLERCPELIISIFSALKLGITYIPIDPIYPQEKIDTMIKKSNSNIVITLSRYKDYFGNKNVIFLDSLEDSNKNKSTEIINCNDYYKNIAYIIFTSGSTGVPNGVAVYQTAVINLIEGLSEVIDFSKENRIACFTSCSFDIFVVETILALCKGLTIVLANETEQFNPKLMDKLICSKKVTMLQMTPSTMQMLVNYDEELSCLKNIKTIMLGGEKLSIKLLRLIKERTNARIYNMYGPTETTVWSAVSELTNKDRIDIGKPIKNTGIYIVDDELNEVQAGQEGELCIAGAGLAAGYFNNEKLTKDRFVFPNHVLDKVIYRTGDNAKILEDGCIEYVGRKNNQVKLRGFRFELERLEEVATQFNGIKKAIAVIKKPKKDNADSILCMYFTHDINIDINILESFMLENLPRHMVPDIFIPLDDFIYTANGKIDRKALENMELTISNDSNLIKELPDDICTKIIDIICEVTGTDENVLNINTKIAQTGLNSILFVKMTVLIEEKFGVEFPFNKLNSSFFNQISSLVEYVNSLIVK